MAIRKQLIYKDDARAAVLRANPSVAYCIDQVKAVDAVSLERYNDLREAFVDYVCSGVQNPAPYCRNRCAECVDRRGWCISQSDKCRGFNPDGAKMDGDGND